MGSDVAALLRKKLLQQRLAPPQQPPVQSATSQVSRLRADAGREVAAGRARPPATFGNGAQAQSDQPVLSPQARPLREPENEGSATEPRIIDVHFHVVNKGQGAQNGDVTQEQIDAQLKVLNDAYKDSGFQFRLADVDRTTNAAWYGANMGTPAEREMKTALHKGGADDLNIYSTGTDQGSQGVLGWATFPQDYSGAPKMDGVVIGANTLPGGSTEHFNEGDTATHEIGHWLGLYHTFQRGGDQVADTPEHTTPNYGTPPESTDTLPGSPGNDPVHNYLNYGDDEWLNEFTPGQYDRMQAQWEQYRKPTAFSDAIEALERVLRSGLLADQRLGAA